MLVDGVNVTESLPVCTACGNNEVQPQQGQTSCISCSASNANSQECLGIFTFNIVFKIVFFYLYINVLYFLFMYMNCIHFYHCSGVQSWNILQNWLSAMFAMSSWNIPAK